MPQTHSFSVRGPLLLPLDQTGKELALLSTQSIAYYTRILYHHVYRALGEEKRGSLVRYEYSTAALDVRKRASLLSLSLEKKRGRDFQLVFCIFNPGTNVKRQQHRSCYLLSPFPQSFPPPEKKLGTEKLRKNGESPLLLSK